MAALQAENNGANEKAPVFSSASPPAAANPFSQFGSGSAVPPSSPLWVNSSGDAAPSTAPLQSVRRLFDSPAPAPAPPSFPDVFTQTWMDALEAEKNGATVQQGPVFSYPPRSAPTPFPSWVLNSSGGAAVPPSSPLWLNSSGDPAPSTAPLQSVRRLFDSPVPAPPSFPDVFTQTWMDALEAEKNGANVQQGSVFLYPPRSAPTPFPSWVLNSSGGAAPSTAVHQATTP